MATASAAHGNAVHWFTDRHVDEGRGDAPVSFDPWRSLNDATLAADTHRFAGALRAAGIGLERRMAMLLLDTIACRGALRAEVVPVPTNTLLTQDMVASVLADSRP